MIPYGRQSISASDIDAVIDVLKSDFLTQGLKVPQFEQALGTRVGAKFAVAVSSASAALHIACRALKVAGDMVWTSPNTFVASANCALHCGANIDFVDIDPITYNLCTKKLAQKLEFAKSNKQKIPKVVIPVHFAGQPCDMKRIKELGDEFDFKIIEDASHAIGASYKDNSVGNCEYSDITIFSFHPVKIITTGEGGVITTNDSSLADNLKCLRTHGVVRHDVSFNDTSNGEWYYEQIELGYNYRMTDIQAALGISQLDRLDNFIQKRHEIKERYDRAFNGLPLTIPFQRTECRSSMHLYPIKLHLDEMKKSRKQVFDELRKLGIGVNVHYIPVHTQPYFRKFGFTSEDFPEAVKYYSSSLSLPIYPNLTIESQNTVIAAIRQIVR